MTTSRFTKVLAAALVLGGAAMAQTAQAHTDVQFSIGVPGPVYAPRPVYVAPAPVYAAPAEVYVRPGYDDWRWRREEWRREQLRREEWRREQWRRWHHTHRDGYDRRDWR
jgi:hypothetical protein